jgi:lipopolysaccharide transport system ATP-binding protein
MSDTVIQVENLWKEYRLGIINHHTLTRDLQSWWARVRGKEDPNSQIGSVSTESEDRFWALKEVSFEVKQGEILGIIGRNGAGKTTLLKILSQVTAPTKGEVRFKGRIASLLEVGTGFHPELTGRENIFLNGAILGMCKADIRKKLDEIIAFTEIEKFIDTPVKRYSSGMYVRLAFAVAAHLEPEILIVDEVLAVGDAQFQKKCLGKMENVGKEGRTVLFVSHNMSAIEHLCNSGIVLESGKMAFTGSADAAVQHYLTSGFPSQSTVLDLESVDRPSHSILKRNVQLISCEMIGTSAQSGWQLPYPSLLNLKVVFRVHKGLDYCELGIALCSDKGFEIASPLSSDSVPMEPFVKGTYTVQCFFRDNVLLPGSYYIGLGLRSEMGMEDYLPEAARFDICESQNSGQHKAHTRAGFIVPRVDFQFSHLSSA